MDDKVCDFFREVDGYFNSGTVNAVKFRNFTQCHSYCPRQNNSKKYKCTTNNERINALGSYLHKKISEIDENYKKKFGVSRHIELFMIWLGGKLFKIENDYKATLEESYEKHLMDYMGNYDYWKLLDSNKLYKNATIKKMSDLYGLLDNICKLINEYNKSTTTINRSNLRNSSTQCLNFYRAIYNSVNGCKPYLYLLDNLKMLYENFRAIKMVNNNFKKRDKEFLNTQIKPITTFGGENKYLLSLFAKLSFDDEECREVRSNDEQIGKKIESQKTQNNLHGARKPNKPNIVTKTRTSGSAPRGNPPPPKPQPPPAPKSPAASKPQLPPVSSTPPPQPQPQSELNPKPEEKQQASQPPTPPQKKEQSSPLSVPLGSTPAASHQSGTKDSGINKGSKDGGANVLGGGTSQPGNSEGKTKDDAQKNPNQVDNSSPDSKEGSQGSLVSQTKDPGNPVPAPSGESTSQPSGTPQQPEPGTPGTSTATSKDTQNSVRNPQDSTQNGVVNNIKDQKGGTSGQQTNQGDKQVNQNGDPVNPINVPGSSGGESKDKTQMKINQVGDSSSTSKIPGSENQGTKQGVSSDGIGTLKNPVNGAGNAASGSKANPSTDVKNQHQNSDPNQGVPGGGANGGDSGTGGGNSGTGGGGSGANGLDDQKKSSGGSSDPALSTPGGPSDPASSTPEGSFDWGSSFLRFLLNGTENLNKASQFIQKNQHKVKEATDKINNAYKNTMDNLKDAYDKSSSYISEFINNVTSQLNQVGTSSKPGNSGNSMPQNNDQSQKNGDPSLPPAKGPPINPPPSTPPKDPSPLPQDPQHQQHPQLPSSPASTQQKQPLPQPQFITPQLQQVGPFIHKAQGKEIAQLIKSISSNPNLKKTWNIFPTTWNGSGDCKPEVKFMSTTLVCCTSEQCSLTGILITLVLIPIILSIAYKYLSFGLSKKSEKKNMKRVIKLVDGNRKTKIIISSNDRSKDLKPVINSVGGKKNSLLNIYKLIQADPMPFINLFFLLIFFVYKRKRDTIE
ncbi:PIR protein CIR protein [Plasmodium vinckei lentum]|uniref:PIR protein CIR protein n=1 Tax=Plasmodium vinckei lentum TaxID=138297 RepID=A0A6V7SME3_PLAVN|nr:PIR protein CIR protein [Plasmodium vinckei lentum]